jgi:hypothetical protein
LYSLFSTSNCQYSHLKRNPIIRIFSISEWFATPVNPDKRSSTPFVTLYVSCLCVQHKGHIVDCKSNTYANFKRKFDIHYAFACLCAFTFTDLESLHRGQYDIRFTAYREFTPWSIRHTFHSISRVYTAVNTTYVSQHISTGTKSNDFVLIVFLWSDSFVDCLIKWLID